MLQPLPSPAATPATTAARLSAACDARRRLGRRRLIVVHSAAATHAMRSSDTRSRNSSAGCDRLPTSIPDSESRISTSTSNRSITGNVVLRSSGRPPQMHTCVTRPASLHVLNSSASSSPRRAAISSLRRGRRFPSACRNPHASSCAATSAPFLINATQVRVLSRAT